MTVLEHSENWAEFTPDSITVLGHKLCHTSDQSNNFVALLNAMCSGMYCKTSHLLM